MAPLACARKSRGADESGWGCGSRSVVFHDRPWREPNRCKETRQTTTRRSPFQLLRPV